MFPDFTTYLAADFPLESAHASQPEMRSISACRLTPFQFDNHTAILLGEVQRTGIGKILIEFLRNVKSLSVDEDEQSFSHEPRHTAIYSPCATVGFTALVAFTLAFAKINGDSFAGRKNIGFLMLEG